MATVVEKALGKRAAQFRKKAGLTQERLAERVKVTHETISRFERGVTIPSIATVVKVAKAVGVELHVLFDLRGRASRKDAAVDALVQEVRTSTVKEIEMAQKLAQVVLAQRNART